MTTSPTPQPRREERSVEPYLYLAALVVTIFTNQILDFTPWQAAPSLTWIAGCFLISLIREVKR